MKIIAFAFFLLPGILLTGAQPIPASVSDELNEFEQQVEKLNPQTEVSIRSDVRLVFPDQTVGGQSVAVGT